MSIQKGIDTRIGNYRLTSDSLCYTLKRVGVNENKDSDNFGKETLSFVGYYTSFPSVLHAMLEDEIRGCGATAAQELRNEVVRIKKELLETASTIKLYKACWCKDCFHYDSNYCLNAKSINYMDKVSKYASCEYCEREEIGNE